MGGLVSDRFGYLQEVRQEAGVVRRGRQWLLGAVPSALDPPGHEVWIRLEEERRRRYTLRLREEEHQQHGPKTPQNEICTRGRVEILNILKSITVLWYFWHRQHRSVYSGFI